MLQNTLKNPPSFSEEGGPNLSLADLLAVVKRRWVYFVVPFVAIASIGLTVVLLWPATYLAEGKILVESQQIPTELVRPTVSTIASERIQVIEQRIMTRDTLLSIANRYGLTTGWAQRFSGTEMVDFMKDRTKLKPLELKIAARQNGRQAIAFTIGFEYENPGIATRVANELVTMVLSEDVRTRTDFAAGTTKFLERESRKLEGDLGAIELKISEMRRRETLGLPVKEINPAETARATLKAELAMKSSTYSASHPDIKALKARIAALESTINPVETKAQESELGIEALTRQQEALQKQVETTNQKLSAARLGESLERGQQAERLEVIEQPSLPKKPASPNRPKLIAIVLAAAAAAGVGLVFLLEMMDGTIRKTTDLATLVSTDLIVTLPYIYTNAEMASQASKWKIMSVSIVAGVAVIVVLAAIFLPFEDLFARLANRFSN
uniref:Lipopolysaccharide biosynthesis n=1 Tax=Rhodopseudomonas palustris (strain BisA53) TaxID=316055 RepID=Q07SP2_RHOP5